ncbi:hypothetical protein [Alishewanella longhuensis]
MVAFQVVVAALTALYFAVTSDELAAKSAFKGGLIAAVPNFVFALNSFLDLRSWQRRTSEGGDDARPFVENNFDHSAVRCSNATGNRSRSSDARFYSDATGTMVNSNFL